MTGMIGLGKLLGDDLRDQRGGPDPGIEPGDDRAAVYYVGQACLLAATQACGAATAVAFGQTLRSMVVPVLNPERNRAAMNAQGLGDGAGSLSFQAQEQALNPKHHLGNAVLFGLSQQFFEFSGDLEITTGKYGFHNCQQK